MKTLLLFGLLFLTYSVVARQASLRFINPPVSQLSDPSSRKNDYGNRLNIGLNSDSQYNRGNVVNQISEEEENEHQTVQAVDDVVPVPFNGFIGAARPLSGLILENMNKQFGYEKNDYYSTKYEEGVDYGTEDGNDYSVLYEDQPESTQEVEAAAPQQFKGPFGKIEPYSGLILENMNKKFGNGIAIGGLAQILGQGGQLQQVRQKKFDMNVDYPAEYGAGQNYGTVDGSDFSVLYEDQPESTEGVEAAAPQQFEGSYGAASSSGLILQNMNKKFGSGMAVGGLASPQILGQGGLLQQVRQKKFDMNADYPAEYKEGQNYGTVDGSDFSVLYEDQPESTEGVEAAAPQQFEGSYGAASSSGLILENMNKKFGNGIAIGGLAQILGQGGLLQQVRQKKFDMNVDYPAEYGAGQNYATVDGSDFSVLYEDQPESTEGVEAAAPQQFEGPDGTVEPLSGLILQNMNERFGYEKNDDYPAENEEGVDYGTEDGNDYSVLYEDQPESTQEVEAAASQQFEEPYGTVEPLSGLILQNMNERFGYEKNDDYPAENEEGVDYGTEDGNDYSVLYEDQPESTEGVEAAAPQQFEGPDGAVEPSSGLILENMNKKFGNGIAIGGLAQILGQGGLLQQVRQKKFDMNVDYPAEYGAGQNYPTVDGSDFSVLYEDQPESTEGVEAAAPQQFEEPYGTVEPLSGLILQNMNERFGYEKNDDYPAENEEGVDYGTEDGNDYSVLYEDQPESTQEVEAAAPQQFEGPDGAVEPLSGLILENMNERFGYEKNDDYPAENEEGVDYGTVDGSDYSVLYEDQPESTQEVEAAAPQQFEGPDGTVEPLSGLILENMNERFGYEKNDDYPAENEEGVDYGTVDGSDYSVLYEDQPESTQEVEAAAPQQFEEPYGATQVQNNLIFTSMFDRSGYGMNVVGSGSAPILGQGGLLQQVRQKKFDMNADYPAEYKEGVDYGTEDGNDYSVLYEDQPESTQEVEAAAPQQFEEPYGATQVRNNLIFTSMFDRSGYGMNVGGSGSAPILGQGGLLQQVRQKKFDMNADYPAEYKEGVDYGTEDGNDYSVLYEDQPESTQEVEAAAPQQFEGPDGAVEPLSGLILQNMNERFGYEKNDDYPAENEEGVDYGTVDGSDYSVLYEDQPESTQEVEAAASQQVEGPDGTVEPLSGLILQNMNERFGYEKNDDYPAENEEGVDYGTEDGNDYSVLYEDQPESTQEVEAAAPQQFEEPYGATQVQNNLIFTSMFDRSGYGMNVGGSGSAPILGQGGLLQQVRQKKFDMNADYPAEYKEGVDYGTEDGNDYSVLYEDQPESTQEVEAAAPQQFEEPYGATQVRNNLIFTSMFDRSGYGMNVGGSGSAPILGQGGLLQQVRQKKFDMNADYPAEYKEGVDYGTEDGNDYSVLYEDQPESTQEVEAAAPQQFEEPYGATQVQNNLIFTSMFDRSGYGMNVGGSGSAPILGQGGLLQQVRQKKFDMNADYPAEYKEGVDYGTEDGNDYSVLYEDQPESTQEVEAAASQQVEGPDGTVEPLSGLILQNMNERFGYEKNDDYPAENEEGVDYGTEDGNDYSVLYEDQPESTEGVEAAAPQQFEEPYGATQVQNNLIFTSMFDRSGYGMNVVGSGSAPILGQGGLLQQVRQKKFDMNADYPAEYKEGVNYGTEDGNDYSVLYEDQPESTQEVEAAAPQQFEEPYGATQVQNNLIFTSMFDRSGYGMNVGGSGSAPILGQGGLLQQVRQKKFDMNVDYPAEYEAGQNYGTVDGSDYSVLYEDQPESTQEVEAAASQQFEGPDGTVEPLSGLILQNMNERFGYEKNDDYPAENEEGVDYGTVDGSDYSVLYEDQPESTQQVEAAAPQQFEEPYGATQVQNNLIFTSMFDRSGYGMNVGGSVSAPILGQGGLLQQVRQKKFDMNVDYPGEYEEGVDYGTVDGSDYSVLYEDQPESTQEVEAAAPQQFEEPYGATQVRNNLILTSMFDRSGYGMNVGGSGSAPILGQGGLLQQVRQKKFDMNVDYPAEYKEGQNYGTVDGSDYSVLYEDQPESTQEVEAAAPQQFEGPDGTVEPLSGLILENMNERFGYEKNVDYPAEYEEGVDYGTVDGNDYSVLYEDQPESTQEVEAAAPQQFEEPYGATQVRNNLILKSMLDRFGNGMNVGGSGSAPILGQGGLLQQVRQKKFDMNVDYPAEYEAGQNYGTVDGSDYSVLYEDQPESTQEVEAAASQQFEEPYGATQVRNNLILKSMLDRFGNGMNVGGSGSAPILGQGGLLQQVRQKKFDMNVDYPAEYEEGVDYGTEDGNDYSVLYEDQPESTQEAAPQQFKGPFGKIEPYSGLILENINKKFGNGIAIGGLAQILGQGGLLQQVRQKKFDMNVDYPAEYEAGQNYGTVDGSDYSVLYEDQPESTQQVEAAAPQQFEEPYGATQVQNNLIFTSMFDRSGYGMNVGGSVSAPILGQGGLLQQVRQKKFDMNVDYPGEYEEGVDYGTVDGSDYSVLYEDQPESTQEVEAAAPQQFEEPYGATQVRNNLILTSMFDRSGYGMNVGGSGSAPILGQGGLLQQVRQKKFDMNVDYPAEYKEGQNYGTVDGSDYSVLYEDQPESTQEVEAAAPQQFEGPDGTVEPLSGLILENMNERFGYEKNVDYPAEYEEGVDYGTVDGNDYSVLYEDQPESTQEVEAAAPQQFEEPYGATQVRNNLILKSMLDRFGNGMNVGGSGSAPILGQGGLLQQVRQKKFDMNVDYPAEYEAGQNYGTVDGSDYSVLYEDQPESTQEVEAAASQQFEEPYGATQVRNNLILKSMLDRFGNGMNVGGSGSAPILGQGGLLQQVRQKKFDMNVDYPAEYEEGVDYGTEDGNDYSVLYEDQPESTQEAAPQQFKGPFGKIEPYSGLILENINKKFGNGIAIGGLAQILGQGGLLQQVRQKKFDMNVDYPAEYEAGQNYGTVDGSDYSVLYEDQPESTQEVEAAAPQQFEGPYGAASSSGLILQNMNKKFGSGIAIGGSASPQILDDVNVDYPTKYEEGLEYGTDVGYDDLVEYVDQRDWIKEGNAPEPFEFYQAAQNELILKNMMDRFGYDWNASRSGAFQILGYGGLLDQIRRRKYDMTSNYPAGYGESAHTKYGIGVTSNFPAPYEDQPEVMEVPDEGASQTTVVDQIPDSDSENSWSEYEFSENYGAQVESGVGQEDTATSNFEDSVNSDKEELFNGIPDEPVYEKKEEPVKGDDAESVDESVDGLVNEVIEKSVNRDNEESGNEDTEEPVNGVPEEVVEEEREEEVIGATESSNSLENGESVDRDTAGLVDENYEESASGHYDEGSINVEYNAESGSVMVDGSINLGMEQSVNGGAEDAVNGGTEDSVNRGTEDAVDGGTEDVVDGGTEDSVNRGTEDAVDGGTEDSVNRGTEDAVDGGTEDVVDGGTEDSVNRGTEDAVDGGTEDSVNRGTEDVVDGGTEDSVNRGTEDAVDGGTEDSVNGGTEDSVDGGTEDAVDGGTEDSVNRGTEDVVDGGTEDSVNRGTENAVDGGTEDSVNRGTVDAVDGGTEDSVNGGTEDSANRGTEDSVDGGTEDSANRGTEDSVDGGSEDSVNGVRQEIVEELPKEQVSGTTESSVKNESEESVNGDTDKPVEEGMGGLPVNRVDEESANGIMEESVNGDDETSVDENVKDSVSGTEEESVKKEIKGSANENIEESVNGDDVELVSGSAEGSISGVMEGSVNEDNAESVSGSAESAVKGAVEDTAIDVNVEKSVNEVLNTKGSLSLAEQTNKNEANKPDFAVFNGNIRDSLEVIRAGEVEEGGEPKNEVLNDVTEGAIEDDNSADSKMNTKPTNIVKNDMVLGGLKIELGNQEDINRFALGAAENQSFSKEKTDLKEYSNDIVGSAEGSLINGILQQIGGGLKVGSLGKYEIKPKLSTGQKAEGVQSSTVNLITQELRSHPGIKVSLEQSDGVTESGSGENVVKIIEEKNKPEINEVDSSVVVNQKQKSNDIKTSGFEKITGQNVADGQLSQKPNYVRKQENSMNTLGGTAELKKETEEQNRDMSSSLLGTIGLNLGGGIFGQIGGGIGNTVKAETAKPIEENQKNDVSGSWGGTMNYKKNIGTGTITGQKGEDVKSFTVAQLRPEQEDGENSSVMGKVTTKLLNDLIKPATKKGTLQQWKKSSEEKIESEASTGEREQHQTIKPEKTLRGNKENFAISYKTEDSMTSHKIDTQSGTLGDGVENLTLGQLNEKLQYQSDQNALKTGTIKGNIKSGLEGGILLQGGSPTVIKKKVYSEKLENAPQKYDAESGQLKLQLAEKTPLKIESPSKKKEKEGFEVRLKKNLKSGAKVKNDEKADESTPLSGSLSIELPQIISSKIKPQKISENVLISNAALPIKNKISLSEMTNKDSIQNLDRKR